MPPPPATGRPLSVYVNPATGNQDLPVFNYFGLPGSNDPRTIQAITPNLFQTGVTEMKQYDALVNGSPFEIPAGKVSFSLGLEVIRQDLTSAVDGLFATGAALGYNPAATFAGGSLTDTADFAEIAIPLVSPAMGVPLIYQLDGTVSGRYEKLSNGSSASVPKFTLKWEPLDKSLVFRGTYAKGFIAPSLFSLYGPATGNAPYFTTLLGNGQSGALALCTQRRPDASGLRER